MSLLLASFIRSCLSDFDPTTAVKVRSGANFFISAHQLNTKDVGTITIDVSCP